MRIASLLLSLTALLAAAGAAAYSWWTEQKALISDEQLTGRVELNLERRLNQSEDSLGRQLATLADTQRQLQQQLSQLENRREADRAADKVQMGTIWEELEKLSQSLDQSESNWILQSIAGNLQVIERGIRLRRSYAINETLTNRALKLTARLPPALSARITAALQKDLQSMPEAAREQDLPALTRQVDEIEALIAQLPRPCCTEFAPPAGGQPDPSANLWQRLLGLVQSSVRLTRVEDDRSLQPVKHERALVRAGLGLRLAQVRNALWNYDQPGWEQGWQALLDDAARAMSHDPEGLDMLRQKVGSCRRCPFCRWNFALNRPGRSWN